MRACQGLCLLRPVLILLAKYTFANTDMPYAKFDSTCCAICVAAMMNQLLCFLTNVLSTRTLAILNETFLVGIFTSRPQNIGNRRPISFYGQYKTQV